MTASIAIYPLPQIFGLAGLGWYNTTLRYTSAGTSTENTETKLGYHLGAGVEFGLLPSVRLIVDGRYQFGNYNFRDIPSEIGHRKADFFSLSAGLALFLPPFSR